MKQFFLILMAAASLMTANALAGTVEEEAFAPKDWTQNWTWVSSFSVGPVWANAGRTQTFYLAPQIEKTYAADNSSNALASYELFAGIQKTLRHQMLGRFGLSIATTGNAQLQGTIWDDANPQFANYNYHYQVQTTRVAAKGILLFDKGYWAMPWVSASLGVSLNRAHGFNNTPLIFEALPNSNFRNHTETAFTYTLGVGIEKALNLHWQAGVGYEFADWGQNQLGRAFGQTLNSGLSLNYLCAQSIMFNLTYVV